MKRSADTERMDQTCELLVNKLGGIGKVYVGSMLWIPLHSYLQELVHQVPLCSRVLASVVCSRVLAT